MLKINLFLLASLSLLSSCCNKEDFANDYEKAEGTWKVKSYNLGTIELDEKGSTLTFVNCTTPPCSGTDYSKPREDQGSFSWQLSDQQDAGHIIITDTLQEGGTWGGTWEIRKLNDCTMLLQRPGTTSGGNADRVVKLKRE